MEIVLLAGFLSVAVFLYYLMSRLDNDLGRIRSSTEKTERCHLMIAVSSLYAIQFVLDTYNDIKRDYPNLEVTIVFGQQQEILEYLACGKADLAVVSAETRTCLCLETAFVKFEPRTLRLDESGVLLQPIDHMMHKQALVWSKETPSPLVPEFIRRVGVRNF
ncbi:hypothetical protein [Anaerotruncus colihominis]|uniref:hypothetical protein n=1 Tax=Anaerotruncus colihominis TaxID=169435 RepID=UPI0018A0820C|nr:hypothetical protein [Anaerotruncus colihominis]